VYLFLRSQFYPACFPPALLFVLHVVIHTLPTVFVFNRLFFSSDFYFIIIRVSCSTVYTVCDCPSPSPHTPPYYHKAGLPFPSVWCVVSLSPLFFLSAIQVPPKVLLPISTFPFPPPLRRLVFSYFHPLISVRLPVLAYLYFQSIFSSQEIVVSTVVHYSTIPNTPPPRLKYTALASCFLPVSFLVSHRLSIILWFFIYPIRILSSPHPLAFSILELLIFLTPQFRKLVFHERKAFFFFLKYTHE